MYHTCLFCQADLGRNDAVEHLPIGRRLAFDEAKGRLWVVCRKCERWNLTPFDDRWEAIEQCERLFRDTRVRFSTDEIGLARLREGTELVRIGEPLRPEFAAWRYGDQFGRRRVRHAVWVGAGVLVVAGISVAPKLVGLPIGGGFFYQFYGPMMQAIRRRRTVVRLLVGGGAVLPVTQGQVERTRLSAGAGPGEWRLHIPPRKARVLELKDSSLILERELARTALGQILPRVNRKGGSKNQVQDAVRVLEDSPTSEALADRITRRPKAFWNDDEEQGMIHALQHDVRLALEMGTHEEAERRWLAGELLELEQAWREAEELAAIADKLGIPADVEARLEALRAQEPSPPGRRADA